MTGPIDGPTPVYKKWKRPDRIKKVRVNNPLIFI